MSNLISNHRAASRRSQTPSPGGSVATISTPNIGTTGVPPVTPLGPTVSTIPTSSTSSVTHPVLSIQWTHRRPWSSEKAQQSGKASSIHGKGSQTSKLALSIDKLASGFMMGKATLTLVCRHA
ncbi:hypothetical protein DVH24_034012 [Malus domestica]|uniref:Uncharacterized protein n=1 Tax=Malus domestica TaxID=3750 RepID=A0A498KUJ5_MALDO|nr:hypothetical protein DVH24_034012 [Malus domestica]